jgi:hypothetical protein
MTSIYQRQTTSSVEQRDGEVDVDAAAHLETQKELHRLREENESLASEVETLKTNNSLMLMDITAFKGQIAVKRGFLSPFTLSFKALPTTHTHTHTHSHPILF